VEVATSPRFNFVGNIVIGKDLELARLRAHYHAILFAYGASKDRKLGIPGEDLDGIHSARAFVGWYNGLPEFAGLAPDLESGDTAVVIGQGNVALDVARTLLGPIDRLRNTDIASNALETLSRSRIRRVHIVGRRGPMQASFTIKEVRELMQLPHVTYSPIPAHLLPDESVKLPRAQRRLADLLSRAPGVDGAAGSWSLEFMLSPARFNGDGRVSSVDFDRTRYRDEDPFDRRARILPTDGGERIDASIVFRSIGYRAEPIPGMEDLGIDFDTQAGIIPNDGLGRVLSGTSRVGGLYCAGWVKCGPTGVIASTMGDAFATADAIAEDWKEGAFATAASKGGWDELGQEVGKRTVNWQDWLMIDAAERERGRQSGKEREKFQDTDSMLRVMG
jgi:adrenodoxin-NADP+ reductase